MACDTLTFDVQCIILGDVMLELVKQHFSMLAVVNKYPCILQNINTVLMFAIFIYLFYTQQFIVR